MVNVRQLNYLWIFLLFTLCVGQTNVFAIGVKKGLSLTTHHKLKEAVALSEAGKAPEAIKILRQQAKRLRESSYDLAMVQQYLVYAYLRIDELTTARDIAVKVHKSRQLPKEVVSSMGWLIAQVDFQNEAYASSMNYLKPLLSIESPYRAKAHFLTGFSHYKLMQFKPAEEHLKRAIALEKKIPDNWYQLLLSIYMDKKRYSEAEPIVQTLIGRDPEKQLWWRYLVGIYMAQNREDRALATLLLAHYQNHLETRDLMRIVRLYNYRGIPDKAARLLQIWLKEARLDANYKTLKLQFELWYLAHERGPAMTALNRAALLSDDGEDYLLLGRIQMQRNEWLKARKSFQQALRNGVKESDKAELLLGISAYRSNDSDAAMPALEKASKNSKLEQEASYWIRKVRGHSKRGAS